MFWNKPNDDVDTQAAKDLREAIKKYNVALQRVRDLKLTFGIREHSTFNHNTIWGFPLELNYIYRLNRKEV